MEKWDFSQKDMPARIRNGAYDVLVARGWDSCTEPNRDGKRGVVVGRYNPGGSDDHIAVRFDDGEEIGFPPLYVEVGHD